jgi:hypothetical protein
MSQQLTAIGGTAPYTWSVIDTLPTGLSLSSGGLLSGTPTVAAAGAYYTLRVTDAASATADTELWIEVRAAAVPTPLTTSSSDLIESIIYEAEMVLGTPSQLVQAIVYEASILFDVPTLPAVFEVVFEMATTITDGDGGGYGGGYGGGGY